VQQAAELSVAIPTVASSLDARFLSGLKVDPQTLNPEPKTQNPKPKTLNP
jgi:hypothetical protein